MTKVSDLPLLRICVLAVCVVASAAGCGRISGGVVPPTNPLTGIQPQTPQSAESSMMCVAAASSQAGHGSDGSKVSGTISSYSGTVRTVSGYTVYGSVQGALVSQ